MINRDILTKSVFSCASCTDYWASWLIHVLVALEQSVGQLVLIVKLVVTIDQVALQDIILLFPLSFWDNQLMQLKRIPIKIQMIPKKQGNFHKLLGLQNVLTCGLGALCYCCSSLCWSSVGLTILPCKFVCILLLVLPLGYWWFSVWACPLQDY